MTTASIAMIVERTMALLTTHFDSEHFPLIQSPCCTQSASIGHNTLQSSRQTAPLLSSVTQSSETSLVATVLTVIDEGDNAAAHWALSMQSGVFLTIMVHFDSFSFDPAFTSLTAPSTAHCLIWAASNVPNCLVTASNVVPGWVIAMTT